VDALAENGCRAPAALEAGRAGPADRRRSARILRLFTRAGRTGGSRGMVATRGAAKGGLMSHAFARTAAVVVCSSTVSASAVAQNCGWSRIDHVVGDDASGMWNPKA
jgi:hypothetical protein